MKYKEFVRLFCENRLKAFEYLNHASPEEFEESIGLFNHELHSGDVNPFRIYNGGKNVLHLIAYEGSIETWNTFVAVLSQRYSGASSLSSLSSIMKTLLHRTIDVCGMTPIVVAISQGHPDIALSMVSYVSCFNTSFDCSYPELKRKNQSRVVICGYHNVDSAAHSNTSSNTSFSAYGKTVPTKTSSRTTYIQEVHPLEYAILSDFTLEVSRTLLTEIIAKSDYKTSAFDYFTSTVMLNAHGLETFEAVLKGLVRLLSKETKRYEHLSENHQRKHVEKEIWRYTCEIAKLIMRIIRVDYSTKVDYLRFLLAFMREELSGGNPLPVHIRGHYADLIVVSVTQEIVLLNEWGSAGPSNLPLFDTILDNYDATDENARIAILENALELVLTKYDRFIFPFVKRLIDIVKKPNTPLIPQPRFSLPSCETAYISYNQMGLKHGGTFKGATRTGKVFRNAEDRHKVLDLLLLAGANPMCEITTLHISPSLGPDTRPRTRPDTHTHNCYEYADDGSTEEYGEHIRSFYARVTLFDKLAFFLL